MADSTWPGDLSPFRTGFLKVAFFIGGVWVDVPMTELHEDGVQIKRGRGDENGKTDPLRLNFSLKDPTGKYAPRNPSGPFFGLIGRGTKVRVQVELVAGVVLDRAYATVVTWVPRWTKKGGPSARVDIEAAGTLRRLGQGASPLRSSLYRHETTMASPTVQAYWPMEDGRTDGALLTARGTGSPLNVQGRPKYAAFSDLTSSGPLLTLQSARVTASPKLWADPNLTWTTVRFVLRVPAGTPAGATLVRVVSNGGQVLTLTYSGGTLSFQGVTVITGIDDQPLHVWLAFQNSGANMEWQATARTVGAAAFSGTAVTTIIGGSFGGMQTLTFNPNLTALPDVAVGHLSVIRGLADSNEVEPFDAWTGETAIDRVIRLVGENGLNLTTSIVSSTAAMGPQTRTTLLALLRECEETDGGFLAEPRTDQDLQFRALDTLYSQAGTTLPYVENMYGIEPVEDDQNTRNRVTVTRSGGGSATVTETAGALGTTAVGVYDEEVTLSLATDAAALQQAGWRVHLGTTDEARWPQIAVDLAEASARPDGRAPRMSTGTRSALLALNLGDRVDITGLPAWLPPFSVSQLVQGYTEVITPKSYRLVFTCAPARPYRVAFWTNAAGRDRYSGDGTTVAAPGITTTTQTTFTVTPPSPVSWTTTDLPFVVRVNGEDMTVTAVTAIAGGTQTFTVTRGVNGVRKTHATLSAVTLADPCYYGL